MRLVLMLALVLACSPAAAQEIRESMGEDISDGFGGGTVSPVVGAVSFGAGTANPPTTVDADVTLVSNRGVALTFARSDSTFCWDSTTGSGVWMGPNRPCILSTGIEVYGAASNTLLQSQTIATGTAVTSPWTIQQTETGSLTVSADQASAPDGTTTADQLNITSISAGKISRIYQSLTATTGANEFSIWLRTVSGSGTTYIELLNASAMPVTQQACALTTTWSRCTVTGTLAAATAYVTIGANNASGSEPSSQPAISVYAWGAQLTPTAFPMPYRATTSAAYSGSAGTATTLTMPVVLTDPAQWAISVTASPGGAWAGQTSRSLFMLSSGAWGSANSFGAYTYQPTSNLLWSTFDVTPARRDWVSSIPGASAQITAMLAATGTTGSGAVRAWLGGVEQTLTPNVLTGTGLLSSMPSTLTIGSIKEAGYELNGTISRVVQCKRAGGCR